MIVTHGYYSESMGVTKLELLQEKEEKPQYRVLPLEGSMSYSIHIVLLAQIDD
jgi:hypothetical protein